MISNRRFSIQKSQQGGERKQREVTAQHTPQRTPKKRFSIPNTSLQNTTPIKTMKREVWGLWTQPSSPTAALQPQSTLKLVLLCAGSPRDEEKRLDRRRREIAKLKGAAKQVHVFAVHLWQSKAWITTFHTAEEAIHGMVGAEDPTDAKTSGMRLLDRLTLRLVLDADGRQVAEIEKPISTFIKSKAVTATARADGTGMKVDAFLSQHTSTMLAYWVERSRVFDVEIQLEWKLAGLDGQSVQTIAATSVRNIEMDKAGRPDDDIGEGREGTPARVNDQA